MTNSMSADSLLIDCWLTDHGHCDTLSSCRSQKIEILLQNSGFNNVRAWLCLYIHIWIFCFRLLFTVPELHHQTKNRMLMSANILLFTFCFQWLVMHYIIIYWLKLSELSVVTFTLVLWPDSSQSRHLTFIVVRTTIDSGSETLLEKRQACESDTSQALTIHKVDEAEISCMELL